MTQPANLTARFRHSGAAPHLALILVQIMFATWPIVGKVVLRSVPTTGLVAVRVAGAALLFIALERGGGAIKRKDWPMLVIVSLLGVVLNQLLYVKGLTFTSAINATLIGTAIPVFTLFVGVLLGQDRATFRRLGGVYGAYLAVSKDLSSRYGALTLIKWIFIVSCVFTLPVGAPATAQMITAHLSWGIWLGILYIILIPTAGAYYLNAWALARVPPSTVAVYIYLQPLVAFVLAPWLLGETLSWRALVAAVLIFAGVAIVTRRARSRSVKEISERPEALGH